MTILWIVLALIALIVLWVVVTYNRLIRGRFRVDEAWSDIDVQLKRRYDLIPNVVETVKAYASHEKEVFEKVTEARSRAMGAASPHEKGAAENMLTGALKSLFAVAEDYPELRASENFAELQRELADTENRIQASRRFYNGVVRDLNTLIEQFPSNLVANALGFTNREFFELEEEAARQAPKVSFQ
ncbi:MAG: LemA family protein [Parcubacteria group bacterium]|nr:LemA family protein [Parcubacteria group bacterium]